MSSRTYLITLDLLDPTLDLDALKEFIKTSAIFDNWWNHIPGVFLVVSEQSAANISQAIRRYTKEARLLVIESNTNESDGWLPETSWKWVRRRSGERVDHA
jgi:hypothetical protein